MRVQEIIRGILDGMAGVAAQPTTDASVTAYSGRGVNRFRQIVDLADIDAAINLAGADSWQGTKDLADIKGEHPSLYLGTVHGAK